MMTSMSNSTAGRPRPRIFPSNNDGVSDEWLGHVVSDDTSFAEFPGDYWHRVEVEGVTFPLWARFGQTEMGDFVVTGMLLGEPDESQAIGTGALSKIAINDILAAATDLSETDGRIIEHASDFVGRVPTPGGQPTDDRVYAEAARAWALAKALNGTATVSTVASLLATSRPTASRRIQRARSEGLLQAETERLAKMPRAAIENEARESAFNTKYFELPPF